MWAPASAGTALKWAVKWRSNSGKFLGRNIGKNCIAGEKGLESTSWICGRPMKSFFVRQAYAGRISISLTSAPCATAITSFRTGKRGRSGGTWQRFCALSSIISCIHLTLETGPWPSQRWNSIFRMRHREKHKKCTVPFGEHFAAMDCAFLYIDFSAWVTGLYTSFWKYSYPPF